MEIKIAKEFLDMLLVGGADFLKLKHSNKTVNAYVLCDRLIIDTGWSDNSKLAITVRFNRGKMPVALLGPIECSMGDDITISGMEHKVEIRML